MQRSWQRNTEDEYYQITKLTPLISVDLLIKDKQGRYLVGRRNNNPAKGYLFVPGSRIYKNEPVMQAVYRVLRSECGLTDSEIEQAQITSGGVYDHWYDCNFRDSQSSTHYYSIAHTVKLDEAVLERIRAADGQHDCFVWLNVSEMMDNPNIHPYTKYFFIPDAPNKVA